MEILQRVQLLTDADQLDRTARHGAHRQRGATARIAVDSGQHDSGQRQARLETLGDIDRVLAGHRIGDQQDFIGVDRLPHRRGFRHQRLVDLQPAGGVEHHHVVTAEPSRIVGAARDIHRLLAGDDRQGFDAGLLAQHFQLFLGRGPLRIKRRHEDFLLVPVLQAGRDLRRRGRLAGALQPDQHDADRRRGQQFQPLRLRAEHFDKLIVDDLDDHLTRRDGAQHFLADRFLLHLVDEIAHDGQGDVRFKQGYPDVAHGGGHVGFAQRPAAFQLLEDVGQAAGQ